MNKYLGVDRRVFLLLNVLLVLFTFAIFIWYADTTQKRIAKERDAALEFVNTIAVQNDEMFKGVEQYVQCACENSSIKACENSGAASSAAIAKFQSKRTQNIVLAAANFGVKSEFIEALSTAPNTLDDIHNSLVSRGSNGCQRAKDDIARLRTNIENLLISHIK